MLYWNTVTPLLKYTLVNLMSAAVFNKFRLVGGTSLSLQLGHRMSVDIDLFTDADYNTVDFNAIEEYLRTTFPYFSGFGSVPIGMGCSCAVGNSRDESIKLDIYYTDTFIRPALEADKLRLATVEEVAAMKMDVVQRGGRMKDFWDIHEIMDKYSIEKMISLHRERYPYNHDVDLIRANLINFEEADNEFEPICLKGKHWELIKLDIITALQ